MLLTVSGLTGSFHRYTPGYIIKGYIFPNRCGDVWGRVEKYIVSHAVIPCRLDFTLTTIDRLHYKCNECTMQLSEINARDQDYILILVKQHLNAKNMVKVLVTSKKDTFFCSKVWFSLLVKYKYR